MNKVNFDFLDGKDYLRPATDQQPAVEGARPADWAEFVPELGVGVGDYVVTKRQWGAFFACLCLFNLLI
ncbi:hypothetical protein HMPREF0083_01531 [Aneurinibacillus aneurinilyticus ATCC 12856]|jgi:hypothetical protein|uniref:Uncharacterized protein n=1 Tax=Aneurinibacillus aneurinilyticus ATCC 12856 TaxID=649747 RepID=U1X768_ANEAE|nr:hypothetical protein HMPREF0083_01531 [Aneurinibacillus aneurinilyticus ATCC 12856]